MWDAIKAFFIYIVKWLGLIGFTFLALVMIQIFFTQTSGVWKTDEDQVVEDKFMHKGLYFANQYYVTLSNGETNSVFKHDFNALEKGDSFQPFFQSLSWKDFWFLFFITSFFFIIWIALAYFCALEIFRDKRFFQKLEDMREKIVDWFISLFKKNEKTRERWKKGSFLVLIIALSIPYVLMTKNVVIKLIPVGKESAIAEVQDHEIMESSGSRGAPSDTYTLTYTFKDKNKRSYKTKKDVSSYTYHKYANASNIPIFYRKTFPYETFIDTKSAGEVVSTLFRFSNLILLINASLLIYFIKKYIDTWGIPSVKKNSARNSDHVAAK